MRVKYPQLAAQTFTEPFMPSYGVKDIIWEHTSIYFPIGDHEAVMLVSVWNDFSQS